ncbi:MAG: long-chain fatty acid--CoA ligase [Ruminococcaceae bacterium]|nr:long-chain fatty acid--CoA ligase [Oscillospiraceae bacterium]
MASFIEKTREYPRQIRDMLRVSASLFADQPAIVAKKDGEYRAYTYRRLQSDVKALGAALAARGLGGKRIALLGENSYEWVLILLTALCGDFVAVPMDKSLPPMDVAQLCQYAEAAAILYADGYPESVSALGECTEALPFSSVETLLEEGRRLQSAGKASFPTARAEGEPALLLFSQAKTDAPRDALLSDENLCFTATRAAEAMGLSDKDSLLSLLPLHYAYELILGLLAPLSVGASVAFGDGLHAIMKNLGELHPTALVTTPILAEALWRKAQKMLTEGYGKLGTAEVKASGILPKKLALPLRKKLFAQIHAAFGGSLRLLLCGGAPTSSQVMKGLSDIGILALTCYTALEGAMTVTVNAKNAPRAESVGRTLDGAIVDVYNKGEDGKGEIRVKGDGVMLGYYKNDAATAEVIRDGWLYTGDLGYLDKDGYLYLTGRKKNLLVRASGKNVFPEELEPLLTEQPFVKEAVVLGFVNEQKRDYDLVAVLYPDKERFAALYGENYTVADEETEMANALEKVNATLPDHKKLDTFVLRQTPFEKTASRKIRRTSIAESVKDEYWKKR